MKELLAFHGNPAVKEKYLARVAADKEAGLIRQQSNYMQRRDPPIYYNQETPNAYLLDGSSLAAYETELGIPRLVAKVEIELFEKIASEKVEEKIENWLETAMPIRPNPKVEGRPSKFLSAIQTGANLGLVWQQFMAELLDDAKTGIILSTQTDKQYQAIEKIAHLCRSNCIDETCWLSTDVTAVREAAAETAASAKRKDSATASAAAAALWATAAAEAMARWADGVRRNSAYTIDQSAEWAFQRVLTVKYIEADDGSSKGLTFWKRHIAQRNSQIEIVNPLADKFLQVLELAPVHVSS